MALIPALSEAVERDVGASAATVALSMVDGQLYEFVANTACWIKASTALLITCTTKANMAAGDAITIAVDMGAATRLLFDVTGSDPNPNGYARINISGATTAINVGALVKTAIDALALSGVTTTDSGDGTVLVVAVGKQLAIAEYVTNAAFTITAGTASAATAGAGSMFVPSGATKVVDAKYGVSLSVIQDSVAGKSTLTRLRRV